MWSWCLRHEERETEVRRLRAGFTLIELLVTLVILSLILVALLEFLTSVEHTWKTAAVDPFAEASVAFETIADRLAKATLEPYLDYADTTGAFRTATATAFFPDHLTRQSDLAFVCGAEGGTTGWLAGTGRVTAGDCVFFLAPAGYTQTDAHDGLERLLNAQGYFVEFGDESDAPGFILPQTQRWRWRLKQILQPAESLQIYTLPSSLAWVQSLLQPAVPTSVLAENIVTLILLPEWTTHDANNLPVTQNSFGYDSRDVSNPLTRNQLPPRLTLALVVIDETSAQKLAAQNGNQAPTLLGSQLFVTAANFQADLTMLDASLTAQKIGHRIFQRKISLASSAWTETPSQ